MTKQEFFNKHRAMDNSLRPWNALSVVVVVGVMAAILQVKESMDHEQAWIQVFYHIECVGSVFGCIFLSCWFAKRQGRRLGLKCPNCGGLLVEFTGQITSATGVCGLCGDRILSGEFAVDNPLSLRSRGVVPMTKQELISKRQAMNRSSIRWMAGFGAVCFVFVLVGLSLMGFMESEPKWVKVLCLVVFFGVPVGSFIVLPLWLIMWQLKRFGLRCPGCNGSLDSSIMSGQIVMATGACGCCGVRIVNDVFAKRNPSNLLLGGSAPLTKQELASKLQTLNRDFQRGIVVVMVVIFGFAATCLHLEKLMESTPVWIQTLFEIVLVGVFLGVALTMICFRPLLEKRLGLRCPSCAGRLDAINGQVALATGACGRCGERILRDESTVNNPLKKNAERTFQMEDFE